MFWENISIYEKCIAYIFWLKKNNNERLINLILGNNINKLYLVLKLDNQASKNSGTNIIQYRFFKV